MTLTPIEAHAACVLLVLLDLAARAWRIEWLLRGTGTRITFAQAIGINAVGDAACALSPMRIAGEPARLWGMLRAGVPAAAAFVAISVEILAAWPVIVAAAVVLTVLFAPEWMAMAFPRIRHAAAAGWPWIALVLVITAASWLVARRWTTAAAHRLRRPVQRVRVYWRRMPHWPVLASIPMTALNIVSRSGILVVLALAEPSGMSPGALFFGSFVLLYAQLILPTPSGAGVVDLGFLGGAAGDLGAGALIWWRVYSNGVGILLGGVVLLRNALGGPGGRRVRFPAGIRQGSS